MKKTIEKNSMWKSLGFRESPYDTSPLKPRFEDIELLVGRESEATKFCNLLDASSQGILILSGKPGVGKTSFFNVQQYKLEQEIALFGPKLLAARVLCPIQPSDDLKTLALRAADTLYKSIVQWAESTQKEVPKQSRDIGEWISGVGKSGYSIGVSIAGFGGSLGRSSTLPKASDASFEHIADAISALSSDVIDIGFDCSVIALDNLENFDDKQLKNMLISFRDTLFSTPNLWWVLIGKSGLGSLIQSLDPRVSERISGSGIEIKPIELSKLHEAIALRVTRFHSGGGGKSPLNEETYKLLYEASDGELRFVLKYSNNICIKFVEATRTDVLKLNEERRASDKNSALIEDKKKFNEALDRAIGRVLVNSQISSESANNFLSLIVEEELEGFSLKEKELKVLQEIGNSGSARSTEFKKYGITSGQAFSSHYLRKLYDQNLLSRTQKGQAVLYSLRGIAKLAHSYGLLIK